MTIIRDIAQAMFEAEKEPVGVKLGRSADHAFEAEASWVRTHGSIDSKRELLFIRRLKLSRTAEFDGWALVFGPGPNPLRKAEGSVAA